MTTNRLRQLREERGEARTELATLCGVTERTVERWEGGVTGIPDTHKRTLIEHLDTTVPYLMGWDTSRPKRGVHA